MILHRQIKDEILGFYDVGKFRRTKDAIELDVVDYVLNYSNLEIIAKGNYRDFKGRVYDKIHSVYIEFCFNAILDISFYYDVELNKINDKRSVEINDIDIYKFEFLGTYNEEGIKVETNDRILVELNKETNQKRIVEKAVVEYFQGEDKKVNIIAKYGDCLMNYDFKM